MDVNETDPKKRLAAIQERMNEQRGEEMGEAIEGARRLEALGNMLWEIDGKMNWQVRSSRDPELHLAVHLRKRLFAKFTRKGRTVFGHFPRLGETVQYDSPLAAFDDAVSKRLAEKEAGVDEQDAREEAASQVVDHPDA